MIEFIIRESSVSTVSTKCEVAILQCQHTPTISGLCFFFIGKDIQVFLVLQKVLSVPEPAETGITNTHEGILSLKR